MTDEISVRRARPEDLERAAQLAARLVRQHHAVDPGRFFLPDNVEQGYQHWFQHELARREAVILVAISGAASRETIVGYCYGTLEGRGAILFTDDGGGFQVLFDDDPRLAL